jgi:hypothetical protein
MILDLTFRSFPGHNTVGLMCFEHQVRDVAAGLAWSVVVVVVRGAWCVV